MSDTRTTQHPVECRGEVRGCWRWDLAKDPTHVFHVEACPDERCICGRLLSDHDDDER